MTDTAPERYIAGQAVEVWTDGRWRAAHFLADTTYPAGGNRHACWYESNGTLHVDVYAETGRGKFRPVAAVSGCVVMDRETGEYGIYNGLDEHARVLYYSGFRLRLDPARHVVMLLPREVTRGSEAAEPLAVGDRVEVVKVLNGGRLPVGAISTILRLGHHDYELAPGGACWYTAEELRRIPTEPAPAEQPAQSFAERVEAALASLTNPDDGLTFRGQVTVMERAIRAAAATDQLEGEIERSPDPQFFIGHGNGVRVTLRNLLTALTGGQNGEV